MTVWFSEGGRGIIGRSNSFPSLVVCSIGDSVRGTDDNGEVVHDVINDVGWIEAHFASPKIR